MKFVESLDMFGTPAKEIPCLTHKGAPTTLTAGAVGVLYMDTDTGEVYKCTAVADGVYTWEIFASSSAPSGDGGTGVGIVSITIEYQGHTDDFDNTGNTGGSECTCAEITDITITEV